LAAFRKVAYYGGDMADILPEIKMLLIIILVSFVAMLLLLQLKINKSKKRIAG
jgi:ABC-2 type transport system permease protein